MRNKKRLEKELLPMLEKSIYKDYWNIRNEILHGEDKSFNVVANLQQMEENLKRIVELAKEIDGVE